MSDELGTSRRGFLVALGATIIGRFKLPSWTPSEVPAAALPTASPPTEPVRHIFTRPKWSPDHEYLLWTEFQDDGTHSTKLWHIETDEERESAERFYEIVTWRRWKKEAELHALVKNPGPWLIRWNSDGVYGWNFKFLRVADWDHLFGPGSDERVCFSKDPADDENVLFVSDPNKAARCTSAQVLSFIHQLSKNYNMSEDHWEYFEPVLPKESLWDYRAEKFNLPPAQLERRL